MKFRTCAFIYPRFLTKVYNCYSFNSQLGININTPWALRMRSKDELPRFTQALKLWKQSDQKHNGYRVGGRV